MEFTKITSAKRIRAVLDDVPSQGGVYKHYIDEEGLALLNGVEATQKEKADDEKDVYLVYVGLAKDIRYRLKWHLGVVNTSHSCIVHGTLSTLRLTYMSNHKDIECLSQQDDLNDFIEALLPKSMEPFYSCVI